MAKYKYCENGKHYMKVNNFDEECTLNHGKDFKYNTEHVDAKVEALLRKHATCIENLAFKDDNSLLEWLTRHKCKIGKTTIGSFPAGMGKLN